MMHPVQKAAQEWEAKAIEKCRNDPKVAAAGLCHVCMCPHPCICTKERIAQKMLAHFKQHPKGNIERAKSRSWGAGEPMHELMLDLLRIAQDGLKPR